MSVIFGPCHTLQLAIPRPQSANPGAAAEGHSAERIPLTAKQPQHSDPDVRIRSWDTIRITTS